MFNSGIFLQKLMQIPPWVMASPCGACGFLLHFKETFPGTPLVNVFIVGLITTHDIYGKKLNIVTMTALFFFLLNQFSGKMHFHLSKT